MPCHGWTLERSSAEQVGGKRQGNAITNEGLMIDNRTQAKISIRKVKGILTTPGGDSQLKGDKRRNGREEGRGLHRPAIAMDGYSPRLTGWTGQEKSLEPGYGHGHGYIIFLDI